MEGEHLDESSRFCARALGRLALGALLLSLGLACSSQEETSQRWIRAMGETEWKLETSARAPASQDRAMIMYEVTEFPDREATPEEHARAKQFVRESFSAARKHNWFDFDAALEQGYERMFIDPTHFMNREYIRDRRVLDPERPEYLMYYPNPENEDEMLLVGLMFRVRKPLDRGPQIAGPLSLWHYHVWNQDVSYCVDEFYIPLELRNEDGECDEGQRSRWSPEMLHVWFTDHPRGPFSSVMALPPKRLANVDYDEMARRILGE